MRNKNMKKPLPMRRPRSRQKSMTPRRIFMGFAGGLIVIGALSLYQLKYEVMALETQLSQTRQSIEEETDTIRVLRAEWQYLTSPKHLEEYSFAHLNLQKVTPLQIVAYKDFSSRFATQSTPETIPAPPAVNPFRKASYP